MSDPLPQPPAHLGELGAKNFRQHLRRAKRRGCNLQLVDLTVFEAAAEVYEIKRDSLLTIKEEGLQTESDRKSDATKAHPAVSMYKQAQKEYRKLTNQIERMLPDISEANIQDDAGDPVEGLPGA